jgi:hypothetical protein
VTTIGALKSVHISEEVVLQIAALCHCILLSSKTLLNSTLTYRFVRDVDHTNGADDNVATVDENENAALDRNIWEDRDPYLEEESDHVLDADSSAKASKGLKGCKSLSG